MAVGLNKPSRLLPIEGIKIATVAAGIRYPDRDDMVLMTMVDGATTAGVFTQNKFCAAPVTLAKQHLSQSMPRALLINSGNANAGTGIQGMDNAVASCAAVAKKFNCKLSEVLPFSTGVIGEQLSMDKLQAGIASLVENGRQDNWLSAAEAIMTTDTLAKGSSRQLIINGETITITGMVKGSGMINPNMATLLAYVATDACIDSQLLQVMLEKSSAASFNRITVDSDTSTNDALMLIATGKTKLALMSSMDEPASQLFYESLESLLIELATAVIRDAEGATKFVKVTIKNGHSLADCETIAYSMAHSPLVKTALFASDPNWGRLLMAIGKADVRSLDVSKIAVKINDLNLLKNGEPANDYTEAAGQAVFQQDEIEITVDLNQGDANYHVWTSDLSHDYVSINADYRS